MTVSLFDAAAVAVELRLVGGGSYTWEYVDFARALDLFAQESADFAGILRDLQQRKPSTPSEPWEIVVYFDETVPGDPLRLDQRRKFMSFYLAVKDVGPALLKHEFMWLPCAVLRTRIIKTVEGKFSRVLSVFLERLLVQMGNVRDGVYLNALNSLCCFRLGNLLADEDGFRQAYASMGANGMFCCLGCLNVCGNRSKSLAAFDATGRIVDITCVDSSRFHTCTDEDLWEKSDILARARGVPMTKKRAKIGRRIWVSTTRLMGFCRTWHCALTCAQSARLHMTQHMFCSATGWCTRSWIFSCPS